MIRQTVSFFPSIHQAFPISGHCRHTLPFGLFPLSWEFGANWSAVSVVSLNICSGQNCWRSLHLIILYTSHTFLYFHWLSPIGDLSALVWYAVYFIKVYPAHSLWEFQDLSLLPQQFCCRVCTVQVCVALQTDMTQVTHSRYEHFLCTFMSLLLLLLRLPW